MLRKISFAILSFLKEPKKYYSLLFTVVLLTMLSVVIFQWAVSNVVVQNNAYDSFYYFAHSGATQVVKETEGLIWDMRNVAARISMDGSIGVLWNIGKPTVQEEEELIDKLRSYTNYLSYIEGIYIYNERNQEVYSLKIPNFSEPLSELNESEVVDIIKNRKTNDQFSVRLGIHTQSYTEMSYLAYYPYNGSDNAVIIQGNFTEFNKVFDEFRFLGGSNFWIIGSDGVLFYGNEAFPESEKEKLFAAADSQGETNYQFLNYNGQKQMFLSNYSELLDLYFVFTVPKDEIYKNNVLQKSMSFSLTLVLTILLGLFLVFIASRFLAKRYELLKLKLEMPNINFEKQISISREQFFHMLLYSSEGVEKEQWDSVHTQLDFNKPIVLALVTLDDYSVFCSKNTSEKDRELYKYGMINIICELLREQYAAEGISLNAEQLVFFINADDAEDKIDEIFDHARNAILKYLDVGFTVAMGTPTKADGIANQYSIACTLTQYRYIYGKGSNLKEEVLKTHNDKYSQLVDDSIATLSKNLSAGKTDEAREDYTALIQQMSLLSIGKARIYVVILANTFYDVFAKLEKMYGLPNTFQSQTVIEHLLSVETLEEADTIFDHLIYEIEQCFSADGDQKYMKMCDEVEEIIELNYSELNLGLEYIANELQISPSYLSKIYKKIRHIAIPTYIINYRLEKSKEILCDSNMSIAQIASTVGFSSNSYFGVLFRKQFGVSPSEFREKSKSMKDRIT